MSSSLIVRNLARGQPLDLVFMRRIVQFLLGELLRANVHELGIYVVGAQEMTRLNETFLGHGGVTDVISFNYAESNANLLHGEIFVCLDEARIQAKRFRTIWQEELVRYILHGVLHLQGYDDCRKADWLKMKRYENKFLKQLIHTFPLDTLAHPPHRKTS